MGMRFGKVLAQIILKVTDLVKKMFQLGAKIADFLSFGMLSKTDQTQKAIAKHTQIIRDHLPHSPAKMGPLKDLHKVKIAETIAATIKPFPILSAMNKALSFSSKGTWLAALNGHASKLLRPSAANQLKGNVARGNSGGSSTTIHYSPNVSIDNASPTVKADFAQMLKKHKDEILKIVKAENQRQVRLAY